MPLSPRDGLVIERRGKRRRDEAPARIIVVRCVVETEELS